MNITWTNDTRKLSDLVPWEHNPKRMTRKQAAGLRLSIERFGFAVPFLVSPDGDIYDGHQRQALMNAIKEYGPDAVVDVRVSSRPLTDDERRELVVRLKQNQAGWDFEMLPNLYEREELLEWGFEPEELGMFPDEPAGDDPGPQVDRAAELREKWGVELGQLWALGEHRLICGDCTDRAVVEAVMGGEKADVCVTDPPYGSAYDGSNRMTGRTHETILKNDDTDPELLQQFADGAIYAIDAALRDGGVVYCFTAMWTYCTWRTHFEKRFKLRSIIIWVKDNPSAGRSDFFWGYELAFYGTRGQKAHTWNGGRGQTDVWQFRSVNSFGYVKDDGSRNALNDTQMHPTQKPTDLIEHALNLSSNKRDVVVDPFLGSGTTLIACERLGRRCRAVEIEPGYVAVCLERFYQMTGKTPTLLDGAP